MPNFQLQRINSFSTRYGGSKIRPLANVVELPANTMDAVKAAVPRILEAQKLILRAMIKDLGPEGVMDFFGVPKVLLPWMGILQNPAYEPPMLRADVLLDGGQAWICELNIDSSVGGAEAAQFLRIEEARAKSLSAPYDDLATLIGKLLKKTGTTKVCVFDWSHWAGYGSFGLDWLILTLKFNLPGVDVFFATEQDGLEQVDKDTLVYRVFLADDAIDNPDAAAQIFARAGFVLSDFSGEILGNKMWMALLHEPKKRYWLPKEAVAAIDLTIPYTVVVNSGNLAELLKDNDQYFFKAASDFGGKGVICGRTTEAEQIKIRLEDGSKWIAQKSCDVSPVLVTPLDTNEPILSKAVYGLYRIDGNWSGILVRAKEDADIVNVAAGSAIGWAYEGSIS